jgi:hypothetical protein
LAAKNAGFKLFAGSSRNSARMATGGGELLGLLPLGMPSRFVTPSSPGVPVKIWTPREVADVKLKMGGRAVTLNCWLEPVTEVAMKRDHRRVTVSVLAEAVVLLVAAVNAVT